jgi:ABC-type Fe3+-hydroxamate transport system substrate-binding protein
LIRDALGRPHRIDHPPQRVVSLVPSVTETLFDLGVGSALAGATDYCIFPGAARALPRVGGTKNPRIDRIRQLAPDLVHMNLEENLERHAREIEQFAPVFVSEPKSVRDVIALLRDLGGIHGCAESANQWMASIERELEGPPQPPFTFACPIWKDPWMWCGGDTYVSDLVSCAGGTNLLAARERYPAIGLPEVLVLRPDVVFLPDEPFLFTAADASALAPLRVIGPFPGHLFTWHGTRTLLGLQFLREALAGPADASSTG